jgi:hypothetical protein
VSAPLVFNGIDGLSGEYLLAPSTDDAIGRGVLGLAPEPLPAARRAGPTRGAVTGVDTRRLDATGWALVMAESGDPRTAASNEQVREALAPLLAWREAEAGELYRGGPGRSLSYLQGESAADFLSRYGARFEDPVNPRRVPYYLLLVGGPDEIPYSVQFDLDMQYGVGRIYFDAAEDYAAYARGVVAVAQGLQRLPPSVALFGVCNPDDPATARTAAELIEPLAGSLARTRPELELRTFAGERAGRAALAGLMGGERTPAVLFTACHGVGFPCGSPQQRELQGALVCQDWPGPRGGGLARGHYFGAADLGAEARVAGLLAFFFGCYSAGTPEFDSFRKDDLGRPLRIASAPLISRLPQRLLSHPGGGALAVVGHVDRAWTTSFSDGPSRPPQIGVFESALEALLDGQRLGAAMEYFGERYGALGAQMCGLWEARAETRHVPAEEFSRVWRAKNDARNFVVFGDPAVQLACCAPGP